MAGGNSKALKSETAQEIEEAPHSTVIKAAVAGLADDVGGVAGKRLLSFIERVERLEAEKAEMAEDIKEVYGEAKANGYDPAIMRKVIRERKMDADKRQEQEYMLGVYRTAIGMK